MSTITQRVLCILLASPLLAFALPSCSDGTSSSGSAGASSGTAGTGGTGGVGGAGGTGGAGGGTGGTPTPVACLNQFYECGDGDDNDGDGRIDSNDPDCLGACDNTEGNFFGGIPGQVGQACIVDCYFDADSGAGNDGCYWNHNCDPLAVAPNFYPEKYEQQQCKYDAQANTPGTALSCTELSQGQSQECYDYCKPLVPNGCDCFGCCELPAGSKKYVWLGSENPNGNGSCSIDVLSDPDKCQPCTPVPGCQNDCDVCEICVGKNELPPECLTMDGGMTGQCEAGIQPCGLEGQDPCPVNSYCVTGCCQEIPK
ncbi:hypothetical protein [Polyangium jinanense]|uniref:Lipoprotein n=1 Tax=Polyangium jinanense TaxID=2829994 RepID=A0A9X3XAF6_9BACT|nr:hypothetical protein [Polyangium jinanense]MDC3957072.1 hypothetical protein [Polyangium jinanense]MDC3987054.1 hypothetical protein [Polyangium jinanense]